MEKYDIPVAVFMFKRAEKTVQIIDQIAKVRPEKIYLIGDGPRNEQEREAVEKCRKSVEEHITWDCEIIRNYSEVNRGVYQNIAGGAKWVFAREERAIFLEDDNFPDLSFFPYCKELLEKYEHDTRVLWICGTNYMQTYEPEDGSDYVFTQLMLPCGWASWADKFTTFYDGDLTLYRDPIIKQRVENSYPNKLLYSHEKPHWDKIIENIDNKIPPISWDYQMAYALRVNNLYGIAPKFNLIKNIGADADSIHGGVSMDNEMTRRFCEVPTCEMAFPMKHPKVISIDPVFEHKTEQIIIPPFKHRFRKQLINLIKKMLFINKDDSLIGTIKQRIRRLNIFSK